MVSQRFSLVKSAFSHVAKFYALFVILLIHAQQSRCSSGDESPDTEISFSTPEECARTCVDDEPPKYCHYKFHVEFYTTVGPACNVKEHQSQCVRADGFEKTITTINRQLPGPKIQVCLGDYVIIDVKNAVLGQEVTIHWHGMFQNGYQYYDGVPYVTQCPIPSSTTFRYQFKAENSGTNFYHSHISTHMLDGQNGPLIVKDPPSENPHHNLYDEDDHVIMLNDWMHEFSVERFPGRIRHGIGQTADNFLINGRGNWTDPDTNQTTNENLTEFVVTQNKRYRFRMINSFSTVCLAELSIQNHNMTIIAQDTAKVKPKDVDIIISATGQGRNGATITIANLQLRRASSNERVHISPLLPNTLQRERVDVIIHANQPVDNYYIVVRGLGECAEKRVQQLAILKYVGAPSTPSRPLPSYDDAPTGIVYNPVNGTNCNSNDTSKSVCANQLKSVDEDQSASNSMPDLIQVLDFWFFSFSDDGNKLLFERDSYRSFINTPGGTQATSMITNYTFQTPSSPLISDPRSYETICKTNEPNKCTEPCTCTQVYHLPLDTDLELLIYDRLPVPGLSHPFHLHGHEFQVLEMGQHPDGRGLTQTDINEIGAAHVKRLKQGEFRDAPGKDTVRIPSGGYAIIRFVSNNPGWWLIHCHFSWHHLSGMEMVIHVGEEEDLPPVPPGFPTCSNWVPPIQALNDFYSFRYPTPH